jgi:hypothetical protein
MAYTLKVFRQRKHPEPMRPQQMQIALAAPPLSSENMKILNVIFLVLYQAHFVGYASRTPIAFSSTARAPD